MPKKERVTCDGVLKEMFQTDHPSLLDEMTDGAKVTEFLNVEFPHSIMRRADLVARLENGGLTHIEFQAQNDNDIGYRVGIYGLLASQQYRQPVQQVVLYVGEEKMRMKSRLNAGSTKVAFRIIDIREFDAEVFIRSGRPGDLALAALAKGGTERLIEIANAIVKLEGPARDRVLLQLTLLLGLRKLPQPLKIELAQIMYPNVDVSKNEFLRDWFAHVEALGVAKGEAKGEATGMLKLFRQQLRTKFGKLPKWADDRLANATTAQIERWSKKFVTARTLEVVLGNK